ncbi:MAG: hypothetical protein WCH43_14050, partial [Verrucomicrobiota bacterium]
MVYTISIVSHGLSIIVYLLLALAVSRMDRTLAWRWPVLSCCLATVLWAGVVVGVEVEAVPPLIPRILEVVRDGVWLYLLLALLAGIDTGEQGMQRRLSARWLLTPGILLVVATMVAAEMPAFATLAWLLQP